MPNVVFASTLIKSYDYEPVSRKPHYLNEIFIVRSSFALVQATKSTLSWLLKLKQTCSLYEIEWNKILCRFARILPVPCDRLLVTGTDYRYNLYVTVS